MTIHKKDKIQYDERDTMFSRMAMDVTSKAYEDYYDKHSELKEIDNHLRSMPHMFDEGTATYNPIMGPLSSANFDFMAGFRELAIPEVAKEQVPTESIAMTKLIKNMVLHYGAGSVGITKMTDDMYYSHRGRREHRGKIIDDSMKHPYGIVFTIPMNQDMMLYAPGLPAAIEVSNAYVKAAVIGMQISYYLAQLGYKSRNHMDANYLVIAPRVATAAGLGEFGRHGLLITKEYGPNVRLGVVTTDLSLEVDNPIEFGVKAFCKACKKCVRTCPGKAITDSNKEEDWQINHESCYTRWRSLGTDCSICLSNCPFTYKMADVNNVEASLKAYEDHFGIRPYNRVKPDWFVDYKKNI